MGTLFKSAWTLVGLVMLSWGIIGMILHFWIMGYERNKKRI
ncbi:MULTISPECIES: hypothetical protein [Exiguobacterium]|nr:MULTISPECIES: hypothetical protein [Exiguobacterium]MCT4780576.1 hypothetical protein [Exiguobacterium soli]